jgi:hypothetical protein
VLPGPGRADDGVAAGEVAGQGGAGGMRLAGLTELVGTRWAQNAV